MKKTSKLLGMTTLIVGIMLVFSLIGCGGGGGGSNNSNNPQTGNDAGAKITALEVTNNSGGKNQLSVSFDFSEVVWSSSGSNSYFKLTIDEKDYPINIYGLGSSPFVVGHSCLFEDENHVTLTDGTEYEVTIVYTKPADKTPLDYDRKDANHDNVPVPSFTVTKKIAATVKNN